MITHQRLKELCCSRSVEAAGLFGAAVDSYSGFLRHASEWLSHRATDVILLPLQCYNFIPYFAVAFILNDLSPFTVYICRNHSICLSLQSP